MKTSGATSWLLQRISGAILTVLLLYHFFIMHYGGEEVIKFQEVKARLISPSWKLFYVAFLILGFYHGLNGLRSILIDFDAFSKKDTAISVILTIIGLIALGFGIHTVYSI